MENIEKEGLIMLFKIKKSVYNTGIIPGPSSQTSTIKNHIVKKENLTNIGFFNIESPEIHTPIKSWDEIANRTLEENKELWERLAKL
jgi:hypothetical protein